MKHLQKDLENEKNAKHEAEKCMHMAKIEAEDTTVENEELRRKLRMIDQEIQRLTDRNDILLKDNAELKKTYSELEERNLHSKIAVRKEFTEKNTALLQDLEVYRKRADDHEQESKEANLKLNEKVTELAKIKRKAEKSEARKQRVIDKLLKANETLKSKLLERDHESSEMKERWPQIEAEISERDLTIIELSKRNNNLKERLNKMKTKYKDKLKKIKAEQKAKTGIMEYDELNGELETVSKQKEHMENNYAQLQSMIEGKDEAIRVLKETTVKFVQLTKTNQNLVKELQRKEFLKEELQESQNKIKILTEKNHMLERELKNKVGSELEDDVLEKDDYMKNLQQTAITLEQLTKTNQDLIGELGRQEVLKDELQQSQNEIMVLTEQNYMLEKDLQIKESSQLDNDITEKDGARRENEQGAVELEQLTKSSKEELQQSQNEFGNLFEENTVVERGAKEEHGSGLENDNLEQDEAIRDLQESAVKLKQLTKSHQDLMTKVQGKESLKEGLERLQNEVKILTQKTSLLEKNLKSKGGLELENSYDEEIEASSNFQESAMKLEELTKTNQNLVKELQGKESLNEELLELLNEELEQSQNEIEILAEKNSALERNLKEKEGLKRSIEEHINELHDLQKRSSMLEYKTSGILTEIKERDFLEGQLQESRMELESLEAKNSNLETKLKQRTSFASDLQVGNAELEALLKQKEELKSELEARRASMDNLEKEIEERERLLDNELHYLRMKVSSPQMQGEKLPRQRSVPHYEQSRMETISEEFNDKSKEFNNMQQELAQLQSKIEVAENAKNESEHRCQDLNKELQDWKEACEHLASKQRDLKKKFKAKEKLCRKLAAEKTETADRLADKEDLLHESHAKVLDLEAKVKELYRKIINKADLSLSLEEAHEQLNAANENEQALQSEKLELNKKLGALQAKLEAFKRQAQEIEGIEDGAADSKDRNADKISELKREIKEWQNIVGDLESLLASSQERAEEITKQGAKVERQLNRKITGLNEEIEQARDKIEICENELQKQNEEIAQSTASLEQKDFEIEAKNERIAEIDEERIQLLAEMRNLERMTQKLEGRIKVLEIEKKECQKERKIFECKLKKRKKNYKVLKSREDDWRKKHDEIEILTKEKKDLMVKCEDLENQLKIADQLQMNVETR